MQKTRVEYIDVAKGITMLMVIGLHTGFHANVGTYIEMPTFFLLSGIFFNTDCNWKTVLLKKINSLLVPCIIWYLPIVIYNVTYSVFHSDISIIQSFQQSSLSSAVWFLLSLFEVEILFYALTRVMQGLYLAIVVCVISFVGWLLGYNDISIPFFVDTSMTCLFYLYIGYILKNRLLTLRLSWKCIPIVIVSILLCYFFGNKLVFYRDNQYDENLIMFVVALAGSILILMVSKLLERSSILRCIGQHTLIILCTHLYIAKILSLYDFIPFIKCVLTVILSLGIGIYIKKFIPSLCGINRFINLK